MAKIHQCLGHPNKVTLMRMLTLAGAPKEIIELAGRYECPIGAQVNAPSRYPKEMHLDLKYIYIYIRCRKQGPYRLELGRRWHFFSRGLSFEESQS